MYEWKILKFAFIIGFASFFMFLNDLRTLMLKKLIDLVVGVEFPVNH